MHAGSIATSERLRQTLSVLSDGSPHTTDEIRRVTRSVAVHSDVAALRANGCAIPRARYVGRGEAGCKLYEYRLVT